MHFVGVRLYEKQANSLLAECMFEAKPSMLQGGVLPTLQSPTVTHLKKNSALVSNHLFFCHCGKGACSLFLFSFHLLNDKLDGNRKALGCESPIDCGKKGFGRCAYH